MSCSRNFTLLEVMIGVALLVIVSGSIFWRLQRMVERSRFDSDANRLRSIFLSTRSLAINTKLDFRLELNEISDGWSARIICREDPDHIYRLSKFSALHILFNQKRTAAVSVDFYSSGFVGPKGVLTLSKDEQICDFKFPDFFYRQEASKLPPLHPSEVIFSLDN